MKVSKITIGRLFNLGSYEHVRYEMTVEVRDGESAASAIIGLEKVLEGLKPESQSCTQSRQELARAKLRLVEMRSQLETLPEDEFRRKHGHFEGTPAEYVARCERSHFEAVAKRDDWERISKSARRFFDDIGGAEHWKDCKLDWETDDY